MDKCVAKVLDTNDTQSEVKRSSSAHSPDSFVFAPSLRVKRVHCVFLKINLFQFIHSAWQNVFSMKPE